MLHRRVRFIESVAGIYFAYGVGDIVELKASEAKSFVSAGCAEYTKEELPDSPPVASLPEVHKAAIIEPVIKPKAKKGRPRKKK